MDLVLGTYKRFLRLRTRDGRLRGLKVLYIRSLDIKIVREVHSEYKRIQTLSNEIK